MTYIDDLKNTDLRPKKFKLKEFTFTPEILNEDKTSEVHSRISETISELPVDPLKRELAIIRLGMISELDVVNLYDRLSDEARDPRIKKVFDSVSREEKVHVGEFEELLDIIGGEKHEEPEEEGEEEVEDLVGT